MNYYDNMVRTILTEFNGISENKAKYYANVIGNYIRKQHIDIYELHISKDNYITFEYGYYSYHNIKINDVDVYLTIRVD